MHTLHSLTPSTCMCGFCRTRGLRQQGDGARLDAGSEQLYHGAHRQAGLQSKWLQLGSGDGRGCSKTRHAVQHLADMQLQG